MLQSQPENILFSVNNNLRLFERMDSCPDITSRKALMQQAVQAGLGGDSFKVSYVGKAGVGAPEQYIESIYSDIDVNGVGIILEINAVNGRFFISFLQEWRDDVYYRAFLNQLAKESIGYEDMGGGPLAVSEIAFG